jgi:hypothetical protein
MLEYRNETYKLCCSLAARSGYTDSLPEVGAIGNGGGTNPFLLAFSSFASFIASSRVL